LFEFEIFDQLCGYVEADIRLGLLGRNAMCGVRDDIGNPCSSLEKGSRSFQVRGENITAAGEFTDLTAFPTAPRSTISPTVVQQMLPRFGFLRLRRSSYFA
jgi:hypothetical protein